MGYAHSVEVWDAENLVGGIYGIALGKVFFAESMVSLQKNGSKFGLKFLVDYLRTNNFQLLEVQFMTNHLKSLGAVEISDAEYMKKLTLALEGERSQS